MDITSGTMTSRIDKLEKKGLVKRKIKKNDKRGVNVGLTKKGLKLIDEVIITHVRTQEKIVAVFDEEEQLVFISLLQKYLTHNVKKNNNQHVSNDLRIMLV
jgi:DNA-binding MarR family transcriptional regulator